MLDRLRKMTPRARAATPGLSADRADIIVAGLAVIDRIMHRFEVNTLQVHNLIVCTLCSCYPRPVLGLPPDWYKSRVYRSRAVREPRALLAEFGTSVPDDVTVRVHDSTADMRYMVLPLRPAGSAHLSEEELAQLVTRDSMIGVITVPAPEEKQVAV